MGQKVDINLKNSLNTHTIAEDVRSFQDVGAPALQNTGIERDGGITNLYETAEAYAVAGDHFITESGQTLQSVVSGDLRLISVGDKQIGQTSAYGVQSRTKISGVDDAAITTAGTYITAAVRGSGIEVCEYSALGVLLHSRTTTFANLAAVLQFFTSLSIIRYNGIDYADSLEFALRLGDQVIFLNEATPAQDINKSIIDGQPLGDGVLIHAMIVYKGFLVVAGEFGHVSSFDGLSWKYYDGSGSGTGPFDSGTSIVAGDIRSAIEYAPTAAGESYLVFGGSTGNVCSFYAGIWNPANKAGTGVWSSGVPVGASSIRTMVVAYPTGGSRYLVIGDGTGRIGSYTPAGWIAYTAGAGLRNNQTIIGVATWQMLNVIVSAGGETILVSSGGIIGACRVGSMRYTGGAWNLAVYTDGHSVNNPTNNGTANASRIISSVNFGAHDLIFGDQVGTISMLKDWAWHLYTEAPAAGVCVNNATALGAAPVYCLTSFGTTIVAFSLLLVASWDQINWKNSDGTGIGTGIYTATLSLVRVGNPYGAVQYGSLLMLMGAAVAGAPAVNSVTIDNVYGEFYYDGWPHPYGNLLKGYTASSYLYCYRYENGKCLLNVVDDPLNVALIIDNATKTIVTIYCRYAIPQISGGFTRHIIASDPVAVGGTQIRSLGLVGYTNFVAFSAVVIYPDCAQTTAIIQHGVIGFNYSDFTFKLAASATNIYNYLSQLQGTPDGLFRLFQSQTITNVDAYGKLTNGYGVTPSVPFEFRVGLINGVMSFLSAGVLDGIASDTMGTLLTNVGEFDPDYTPDFHDDRILYRYNGSFFLIVIGTTLPGNVFQKIAPEVYKINTISPLNIISMIDESLHVGSSDYNGRMIFEDTAAPSVTATNVAAVLAGSITANPLAEGIFSNSIDVGDKLVYISAPDASNISVPGFRIPYGWQSIKEMISVYIADIYAYSVANDGSELVLPNPSNPVYVPDTRLPLAIGLEYEGGAVNTGQQTIFINPNYDGYTIGNEAKGIYDVFQLYGTVYLFDGFTIYQASVTGNVYGGLTAIAPASGLTFLSATPTQAYFLSAFDNAVFVFNGGRSLSKFQRLNQLPAITGGIFSTRDNALLLETATSFIWVRDDIVTQNLKTAAQTALKLYDTTLGLFIGNDVSRWRYSYASLGSGSAVVPLVWQSSYFGQTSGSRANLEQFFVTIYSPGKTAQIITAVVDSFDEKAHYAQTVKFPITKADYSSAGYYRFRVKPRTQKTLGASLTLTIPAKTVLADLFIEYADDAGAVVAGNATR
jgi:hypothetical protein